MMIQAFLGLGAAKSSLAACSDPVLAMLDDDQACFRPGAAKSSLAACSEPVLAMLDQAIVMLIRILFWPECGM